MLDILETVQNLLEFEETLNIVIINYLLTYSKDMINKHTMPNFQFKNNCDIM